MAYNVLYIEDEEPDSIAADLNNHGLVVTHHNPNDFEGSIKSATSESVDLLLLDFRLSTKGGVHYDAPTIAQTIRTMNTNNHRNLPIVLISSEENISGYYKDYTSQDLFDFAISKEMLTNKLEKYTTRIKSLIDGYKCLTLSIKKETPLEQLLKIPDNLLNKFSIKIIDLLHSPKYMESTFMASTFIVNHIVKPSGVLIGEEILAARLGVDKASEAWVTLKEKHLNAFKYNGIYSDSYDRWWSAGLELWWQVVFNESPHLKRLNATQRVEVIGRVLNIKNTKVATKSEHSKSEFFWTICSIKKTPLDPFDGYEKDKVIEPWEDAEYFSLDGISESDKLKELKALDRARYLEESKGL